jgi:hypothetical protein
VTGGAGPKRKGSAFERDVVHYLQEHGFGDAERSYGAGRPEDVGDIAGVPGITIEVKNHARLELAQWVDEAERERINARQPFAVVIAKRRGKGAAQSYVVMDLARSHDWWHHDRTRYPRPTRGDCSFAGSLRDRCRPCRRLLRRCHRPCAWHADRDRGRTDHRDSARTGDDVKGHSLRHGRSRCCAPPGPGHRAHKRKSVVRQQAERQGGRSQSDPFFIPSAPAAAADRRAP